MSLKNAVTTRGIDPGTVRLVAQRLNHYATPGPSSLCTVQNCSFVLPFSGADILPSAFYMRALLPSLKVSHPHRTILELNTIKRELISVRTMTTHGRVRGIAPLILNLGIRWR